MDVHCRVLPLFTSNSGKLQKVQMKFRKQQGRDHRLTRVTAMHQAPALKSLLQDELF